MTAEMILFWSEFLEPGGTLPPRIPRSTTPPGFRSQLQKNLPTLDEFERDGINAMRAKHTF